jgi:hypothetical protein
MNQSAKMSSNPAFNIHIDRYDRTNPVGIMVPAEENQMP